MKILNLDKFETAGDQKKILVIRGKKYEVEPMTVENFITTTKAVEAMQDNVKISEQIEATIDMILRSVPSIDRAALAGLGLEQLKAIVAFVRGDDDVEGVETTEGDDEGK